MIDSHRGVSGYVLTSTPDLITLLRIYQAVMEEPQIHLLDIHQNPNDQCVVGRHIRPVLTTIFEGIEKAFARKPSQMTLADCIEAMRAKMSQTV